MMFMGCRKRREEHLHGPFAGVVSNPGPQIQACRIQTPLEEWWKFAWYLIAKYGRQVVTYNDTCLE